MKLQKKKNDSFVLLHLELLSEAWRSRESHQPWEGKGGTINSRSQIQIHWDEANERKQSRSPSLANHLFSQVIYMYPEEKTCSSGGISGVGWGHGSLIWATNTLMLTPSWNTVFKVLGKGTDCICSSLPPPLSLDSALSSSKRDHQLHRSYMSFPEHLTWHVVNNPDSSGTLRKETEGKLLHGHWERLHVQGMALPNDIKGCSQSSGRSGPIKQNACDTKDTNKNRGTQRILVFLPWQ